MPVAQRPFPVFSRLNPSDHRAVVAWPSGGGHWLSLRKKLKIGRKKREPGRKKRKLGRKNREQGRKKREQGSKKREFGRRKRGQQAWGRLLALILSKHGVELSRYSLASANQPQSAWTEAGYFVGGRMVAARAGLFVRHRIRLIGRLEAAHAVGLLAHFKIEGTAAQQHIVRDKESLVGLAVD